MLAAMVHEAPLVVLVLVVASVLVVFQALQVQLADRVTAVYLVKEVFQVMLLFQLLFHIVKHPEKRVFQAHPVNLVLMVHKVVQDHKVPLVQAVNLVSPVVKVQMVDVVPLVHLDLLVLADLLVHKVLKVQLVLPDVVLKTNHISENTKDCFVKLSISQSTACQRTKMVSPTKKYNLMKRNKQCSKLNSNNSLALSDLPMEDFPEMNLPF